MINYLKSEIFRISRTKSVYIFPLMLNLGIIAILGITRYFAYLDGVDFPYNNSAFIFLTIQSMLQSVIFLIPIIVNIIFADEHKNGTFKNPISYGVNRHVLFFGKLILMTIYSLVALTFTVISIIFFTNLMMESGSVSDLRSQRNMIEGIIGALPLLLALLSLSHMLSFVLKKTSSHWTAFFLITIAIPTILARVQSGVGSRFIGILLDVTPMSILVGIAQLGRIDMTWELIPWGQSIIIFLIYFGISTLIGLGKFTKQDV